MLSAKYSKITMSPDNSKELQNRPKKTRVTVQVDLIQEMIASQSTRLPLELLSAQSSRTFSAASSKYTKSAALLSY